MQKLTTHSLTCKECTNLWSSVCLAPFMVKYILDYESPNVELHGTRRAHCLHGISTRCTKEFCCYSCGQIELSRVHDMHELEVGAFNVGTGYGNSFIFERVNRCCLSYAHRLYSYCIIICICGQKCMYIGIRH